MLRFIASNTGTVTENGQASPIRFASVVKDGETLRALHYQFMCRDYLQDQYVASRIQREIGEVYDQVADGDRFPMNLRKAQMVLSRRHGDWVKLRSNLPLLNEFEERIGISKTTLEALEYEGGIGQIVEHLYLEGPPRWMSTSVSYSIYTLLIRVLAGNSAREGETLEDLLSRFGDVDSSYDIRFVGYMMQYMNIEHFMRNVTKVRRKVKMYEQIESPRDVAAFAHQYSGVFAFCSYMKGDYKGDEVNALAQKLLEAGFGEFKEEYYKVLGTSKGNEGLLERLGIN